MYDGSSRRHLVCPTCLPRLVQMVMEDLRRLDAARGAIPCPGDGCRAAWGIEELHGAGLLDARRTLLAYACALRRRMYGSGAELRAAQSILHALNSTWQRVLLGAGSTPAVNDTTRS